MQTIRKQMIGLLEKEETSAREISQAVKIREKEVYEHLAHIGRTVNTKRKKLVITPSQCFGTDQIRVVSITYHNSPFFWFLIISQVWN